MFAFGSALLAELEGVEGKNQREVEAKRNRLLAKWIPEGTGGPKFRDPAKG